MIVTGVRLEKATCPPFEVIYIIGYNPEPKPRKSRLPRCCAVGSPRWCCLAVRCGRLG